MGPQLIRDLERLFWIARDDGDDGALLEGHFSIDDDLAVDDSACLDLDHKSRLPPREFVGQQHASSAR